MGKLSLLISMVLMVLGMSTYVLAQSAPVAQPAPAASVAPAPAASVAAPAAASPVGLAGIVVAIVAGLNVLLSGVQTVFGALAQSEPGWLQTIGSIVLTVSQWLGSNVNVQAKQKSS